jgi:hypothetical protein
MSSTQERSGFRVGDRVRCRWENHDFANGPVPGELGTVASWEDVAVPTYIPVIWDRFKYQYRRDQSTLMTADEIEKVGSSMATTTDVKAGDKVKITQCTDVRAAEGHTATVVRVDAPAIGGQPYFVTPDSTISGWGTSSIYVNAVEKITGEFVTLEEFVAFKKKVWEAAQKGKVKHGWCEEIDKLLKAELGFELTVPEPMEDGTVVGVGEVTGENVYRRAQHGETTPNAETWYCTENQRALRWSQIAAAASPGREIKILWKPGMPAETLTAELKL